MDEQQQQQVASIPMNFTAMSIMELQFIGLILQYEGNRRAMLSEIESLRPPKEDSTPPMDISEVL